MDAKETNTKQEYIEAWNDHISSIGLLAFTPSRELSQEVSATIEKLKELVVKVAEDKKLN